MPAADDHRLTIRRHLATYLLAADHPAPEAARGRLDAALAGLAAGLGAGLAPLARDGQAKGLWLLRRVELDLTLDAALPPATLAATWSRALAGTIARALEPGADGVAWFPDRAAHLARFLTDLAAGRAWGSWIHGGFAGLSALPTAMALSTAMLADPATGWLALSRLGPADLARLLEDLGAAQAVRVLDVLEQQEAGGEARGSAAPLLLADRLEAKGWPPVSPACPHGLALALLAMLPEAPAGLVPLARALALLRHRLALGQGGEVVLPGLAGLAGPLRERLRRLADPAAAPLAPEPALVRHTPFGGAFLLLRLLDEWPLAEATAGWPAPPEGAEAAALLRALVLARCTGGDRAPAFLLDPLWRDLLGLPPRLGLGDIPAWGRGLGRERRRALRRLPAKLPPCDPACRRFFRVPAGLRMGARLDRLLDRLARALLDRLAGHLPGFGGSSPAWLARNILAMGARAEAGPEGLTVTLSRPPLDVVLGMTGLAREALVLPWLVLPGGGGRLVLRRGE
jgi:hypothetical protein